MEVNSMKSGLKVLFGFAAGAAAGYLASKNVDTIADYFDKVCYKLDDLQDQLADYRARLAMKGDDDDFSDYDIEAEEDEDLPIKEAAEEAAEDLTDAVDDIVVDVKEAAEDLAEDALDTVKDAAADVSDTFEELKDDLSDIAGDFGENA